MHDVAQPCFSMKPLLFFLLLLHCAAAAIAQDALTTTLHRAILSRDSLLFQDGFNRCRIPVFEDLLSDSLRFYHDRGGSSDKRKFLADLRRGLCADPAAFQSRRELLPGSTTIYPLYRDTVLYGAVQEGVHQFFEKVPGKPERFGSSAKFTHLWVLEGGRWKLREALSYDHRPEPFTAAYPAGADHDSAIEGLMRRNRIPALGLGVIRGGKLAQIRVYGELGNGRPAPFNTIFNVASLTKPVTAMVALKLVRAGMWSLDEPLYKYYTDPDIAGDPRHKRLTTRQVLSHRTGFPNWRWMSAGKKLRFGFDPGTAYQYSGEGFEYLRKALEAKFRKSLQELAEERVFRPLQLRDTRYVWTRQMDTMRLAPGYDKDGKRYEPLRNTRPNAADDLLTTIGDYGTFLAGILAKDGLGDSLFAEMTRPQVATEKGKHFGLGFEIYDLGCGDYALSHGGSDDGVRTIVFLLPTTGQGLLIFTNSDTGTAVYGDLLKQYLGEAGQQIIDIEMGG